VKKIRKTLGIMTATAGLALTGTVAAVPAHANSYINLYTNFSPGACLRPDSSNLGSTVHLHSCDGSSDWWEVLSQGVYNRLVWMGPGANHGACLIPNWDTLGAPVVVTNGNNGAVCDQPDAYWRGAYPYYWDNHAANLDNNDGLSLDYDISGANRGLQVWKSIESNRNQQFYGTNFAG